MNRFAKNEKGLTLVEVTGVLVLTVVILGFLIYLLNYSSTSLKQVSARETTLQESREIMSQVVKTVRKGYIPSPLTSSSSNLRLINGEETVEYIYDSSAKSLIVTTTPTGTTQPTSTFTLSNHVESILFVALDGRIEVKLEMNLPNKQTQETSTIVYTTQRNN